MFSYGEKLGSKFLRKYYTYRFRIDPVPGIGYRYLFYGFYKKSNMRKRERAYYSEHTNFVRPKRSPRYLCNPLDDVPRGDITNRRCWKNKRIRKQWMKNVK